MWQTDYRRYITAIPAAQKELEQHEPKRYYVRGPLFEYATVGDEFGKNKTRVYSQLRYKGQIVAHLTAHGILIKPEIFANSFPA